MVFNPYDMLPVADEALDKGGVELLRAGLAEEALYVSVRRGFEKPDRWGGVLAEVTRRVAALYAESGDLSGKDVIGRVAMAYERALGIAKARATGRKRKPARAPGKRPRGGRVTGRTKAPAKLKARPGSAARPATRPAPRSAGTSKSAGRSTSAGGSKSAAKSRSAAKSSSAGKAKTAVRTAAKSRPGGKAARR
jgi:hypothetical protein